MKEGALNPSNPEHVTDGLFGPPQGTKFLTGL